MVPALSAKTDQTTHTVLMEDEFKEVPFGVF